MKNKKVFALIVSLALIVGVVLPGTLAFSNEPAGQAQEAAAAADTQLTEEKTQEVKTEEVKTETPKAEATKAQEPQCTCDPKPAEGEAHKEGCPLYVAPEKPAAPSHIDTCSDDCTDAECKCPCHLFNKIMACTTQEALEDLIAETPEEYFGLLSDEQIQKVEAHIKSLETVPLPAVTIENDVAEETVPSEIVRPTVNYTYVAPFGDPVTGGNN